MEIVKIIFEKFGGREMEGIFRNFFFISLLFKQMAFSLFTAPADVYEIDSLPAEDEVVSKEIVAIDSAEDGLNGIQLFKLMWSLALIETKNSTVPNEIFPIN